GFTLSSQSSAGVFDLGDLYVFKPVKYEKPEVDESEDQDKFRPRVPQVTNSEHVVIVLTLNRHSGKLASGSLFSADGKYSLYISVDDQFTSDFQIDVFFGGKDQYAFYHTGSSTPIVGKIGETMERASVVVYAGERDDPTVFDYLGFAYVATNACAPVRGLR